jgi:hypothetical protein
MRAIAITLPVLAFATFSAAVKADDASKRSSELQVLDRFVGTWAQTFTLRKTEWTPEEKRGTGTFSSAWILGDQFVQETGQKADGNSHLTLYTYDKKQKSYRMWYFASSGQTGEVAGKWDADSNTLVWKWEVPNGLTGTGTHHFLNDDTYEFSTVIEDESGKVFFHRVGTSTRTKKTRG